MGQRRMHANRGDDEHDLRWLGQRHRESDVGGSTPLDLAEAAVDAAGRTRATVRRCHLDIGAVDLQNTALSANASRGARPCDPLPREAELVLTRRSSTQGG